MKTSSQPVWAIRRVSIATLVAATVICLIVSACFVWETAPASNILTESDREARVYTKVSTPLRIAKSELGGTWEVLPNSPVAPYYHHDDICFIGTQIGWVCNISGEIWKTTDAGDNWTRVLNKPGTSFRSITFVDEMKGWVANIGIGGWPGGITDPNVLYATNDGGINWTPVTNIKGPLPDGICGIQAVGLNTINGAGRYAGDAYFIRSTDGGESWVSTDLNLDYRAFVDVHFFTPQRGYLTASKANGQAALAYTTDGGETWTDVMTNNSYHYWKIGFASTFGYAVCWAGPDADKWVQTYDGGETWTNRVWGGEDANGIGFFNDQIGWIGTGLDEFEFGRTYETLDGGLNGSDSWHVIDIDPVYNDAINKFLRVGNKIYAAGTRIYRYSPPPVVLGDANDDGVFNNLDIASFVLALTNQTEYQTMFPDVDVDVVLDMNGDGAFDNQDIAAFVAALNGAGQFLLGPQLNSFNNSQLRAEEHAEFDNSLCKLSAISNPDDGRTTIKYKVPEDDNVQITIYVRGGLIYDRPIDQYLEAGTYAFEFTPHDNTDVLNKAREYTDVLYVSIVTGRYRQTATFINPQ